jgi:hypothetical protein
VCHLMPCPEHMRPPANRGYCPPIAQVSNIAG